jgi:hypothetical protein
MLWIKNMTIQTKLGNELAIDLLKVQGMKTEGVISVQIILDRNDIAKIMVVYAIDCTNFAEFFKAK